MTTKPTWRDGDLGAAREYFLQNAETQVVATPEKEKKPQRSRTASPSSTAQKAHICTK